MIIMQMQFNAVLTLLYYQFLFVCVIVMALKPICDMFLPSLRDTTMMQLVTRPISGSFLFFVAVMQTPECLFHQRRRIVADREAKGERQQQAFVKATGFIVIVQGSCICRVPRVQYRQVGIH